MTPANSEEWGTENGELATFLEQARQNRLEGYRLNPRDVEEHANIEARVREGGYRDRHVYELVQNAADAAHEAGRPARVELLLTSTHLYVANDGAPLRMRGVETLLASHLSDKSGDDIGRFGLGFKSVLGISDRIEFFSRSGSLAFDAERAAAALAAALPQATRGLFPVLRMAWPVDPLAAFEEDSVLYRLRWATSIVRVTLRGPDEHWRVATELDRFPTPFVLFVGVPLTLSLDPGGATGRRIQVVDDSQNRLLSVSKIRGESDAPVEATRWRVFTDSVKLVSPEAIADAGRLHHRARVPLVWAVPQDTDRVEMGEFWAFFPLQERSRLPGIANAPWKTNDDRTNLLPGAYNDELCRAMADLVARSLPTLPTGGDPGLLLDFLPRRDGGSAPAETLAEAVWERVIDLPIVPDGSAQLRPAGALRAHPVESAVLVASWLELATPNVRTMFVHDSVLRGKRAGRWRILVDRQPVAPPGSPPLPEWLEMIRSLSQATPIIRLMGAIAKADSRAEILQALRAARILPTTDGELVAATSAFSSGGKLAGAATLDSSLLTDERTRQILSDVLKVGAFGESQWLALLSEQFTAIYRQKFGDYPRNPTPAEHGKLWELIEAAPGPAVRPFVLDPAVSSKLQALAADGTWRISTELLSPGRIIADVDASATGRWAVDPGFAATHARALRILGVEDVPTRQLAAADFHAHPLLAKTCSGLEDAFVRGCQSAGLGNPQRGFVRYLTPVSIPGPFGLIKDGAATARERLTGWLLDQHNFQPATFGHVTQGGRYTSVDTIDPLASVLVLHGLLNVDGEPFRISELVGLLESGALDPAPEAMDLLRRLRNLLAGVPSPPPTEKPSAPLLAALWRLADADDIEDSHRHRLLSLCATSGWLPPTVRTSGKVCLVSEVYATEQPHIFEAARDAGHPAVLVDTAALGALRKAGSKVLADQLRLVIVGEPPILLEAAFPQFGGVTREEHRKNVEVVFGVGLALEATGAIRTPLAVSREGMRVFIDRERISDLAPAAIEDAVLVRMAEAGWLSVPLGEVRAKQKTASRARLLSELAKARDDAGRILAIAGSTGRLLALLPADLKRMAAEATVTQKERIAELFLSVHGTDALRVLSSELESAGFVVPARWGTGEARALASALGFPPGFGGITTGRRDPEILVPGPVRLGELHDYQLEIVGELIELLSSPRPRRRAIISLPTGAGKTRVAVEAVVASILIARSRAPILWVAQGDELCEQAVQCFRQVWTSKGSPDEELKVSRLWGSNSGEVSPHVGGPHVVVATIQTLSSRMDRQSLNWLAAPAIVVIDEAHHAISPSYTGLLRWIEDPDAPDRSAVIGLTATPFKGFDDGETLRLARRFDQRLLPSAEHQPHLYARLQAMGILAKVDHEILDPPGAFEFSPEEIREIEMFGGQHFPESAARRLTEDARRNDRIIARVLAAPPTERILLFAGSPEHARLLAGALTLRGRSAGAVVSETRGGTRQHLISEFQVGRLPVLTNYGVLTTGFDAPKVDTLLIARPTFSPVLYQQMIGRGLRGELNGGKPRCRLITVRDNFTRYGDRLAFHHFLPLFNAGNSDGAASS